MTFEDQLDLLRDESTYAPWWMAAGVSIGLHFLKR